MTRLPGKPIWFDHVSPDAKRAQAFFAETLGWKSMSFPMGQGSYDMILAGDTPDTMIGGYASFAGSPRWISYVSVDDVDAAARAATAAGGKVVWGPDDVPGVGRTARFTDPAGAELAVFTRTQGDPPDRDAPERTFFWIELHTPDPAKVIPFYEQVIGWSVREEKFPGGVYRIVSRGGKDRGGISDHIPPGGQPHWLPYVRVADPDATAARATQHGATIAFGPEDIPGVGRFAMWIDPAGAMLAVMRPDPTSRT